MKISVDCSSRILLGNVLHSLKVLGKKLCSGADRDNKLMLMKLSDWILCW